MTPIEKNVVVVDEYGNEYEATYPKRAKGLVKHGRARFIEENKICLSCPPDKMEDKNMTDRMEFGNASLEEEAAVIAETMENPETVFVDGAAEPAPEAIPEAEAQTAATASRPQKLTVEYILERLEEISKDNTSLQGIIRIGSIPPDEGCVDMAMALNSSIEAHERTNQKLIETYRAIYEDIKPISSERIQMEEKKLFNVNEILEHVMPRKKEKQGDSFWTVQERMAKDKNNFDKDNVEWILDRLTDDSLPSEVKDSLTRKLNAMLGLD